MPSGAKKRKAAKKKQASNSNSATPPFSSTTHSQSGDDDLKHHDGRYSDGRDGEELEKRDDSSSDQSFVSKGKSNQGESTGKGDDEEGIVQIDWDLKPEEDYESGGIDMGSKKKSHDGGSSGSSSSGGSSGGSSSSSSDDESHVVEKKIVVVEDAPVIVDLVEPIDSSPEKVTQVVDDLVKPINPLSEGAVHVIETVSIDNGSSSHVAETFRKVNDVKKLPSLDKNSGLSSIMMDLGSKSEDEEKTKVSVAKETDANPCNGGGNVEESDSQPLVASAPRIVQTTSWKSCCGIFELFTVSTR